MIRIKSRVQIDGNKSCKKSREHSRNKSKWSCGTLARVLQGNKGAYFLKKWGIRRRPGMRRNAGNVILLKIPNTTTDASIAVANREERCC